MNSDKSTEPAPSWIRHLVVAADASPASQEGLRIAVDVARRTGARLSVAHVRHVPAGSNLSPSMTRGPIEETLNEVEAQVRAAAAEALRGTGVEWRFVLLQGSPGDELVRFAEQEDADMVVVGSNRHGSLRNLILGSTSAYLTSHAPGAVLVARPRQGRQPAAEVGAGSELTGNRGAGG